MPASACSRPPPLDPAPVRQVGYGARVLTAEVIFPAPREGVRIRRVGVHSCLPKLAF
jgi:hypothetical protein